MTHQKNDTNQIEVTEPEQFNADLGQYALRRMARLLRENGEGLDPSIEALAKAAGVDLEAEPGPDDDPPYGFSLLRDPDVRFAVEAAAKRYGLAVADVVLSQAGDIDLDTLLERTLDPKNMLRPEILACAVEEHLDLTRHPPVPPFTVINGGRSNAGERPPDDGHGDCTRAKDVATDLSNGARLILQELISLCPTVTDNTGTSRFKEPRNARRYINGEGGKPGELTHHGLVERREDAKRDNLRPTQLGRAVAEALGQ